MWAFFVCFPSFAISREPGFGFPIREGIQVSLKCDVDSNPPSSPIWQKGNNKQTTNLQTNVLYNLSNTFAFA
ncbi:hypothetical protein Phum_PHUM162340 [Pediculus humanus corporis]|uniref:Ig-like domain-containing protein n=1 Tax=Pediculus humanus subsp. corporis TaxID=121224 RepID=E0VFM5_PEDHC|nr:uncharacterized protein Phum_PHUM162340 [Pediculus humanus corporis]EEB12181.1 hypothetical protein Phum_PHUM162340 [Pediculus humanus corporis]